MRKIILHTKSSEKTGLVLENEQICEYIVERPGSEVLSGSIFVGKVENIHYGMQAAFINIGQEKNAFLNLDQIPWAKESMEKTMKVGETLFVQINKEAIGEKGAQVTADLTIPGLYSIFQPMGKKISASRKLNTDKVESVRKTLGSILEDKEGGIIRTAAGEERIEKVGEEFRRLKGIWKEQIAPLMGHKPQMVWSDPMLPDQLIRKYPVHSLTEIIVDEVNVSLYLKERYPSLEDKISWVKQIEEKLPLGINELQEQLIQSVVELDNGVQLVIEPTEAMTVIDVNSHQYKGKAMSNSQAFEVNRKAALHVCKQIRLRNLSGMILIDFINMKDSSLEKRLINFMRQQTQKDTTKSSILGMTRLGIMEMTRKRESVSPVQTLSKPYQPSFDQATMVYRLERDLLAYASHPSEAILIRVNPELYNMKKRLLSRQISSKIPQELFVRQDVDIPDYQIELEGSEDMVLEAINRRKAHVDNLF
ncbi:ribonuclease E/G [Halobacillus sp. BBL2006]|uniref:ribonuclease E/G n=1 Tax=Halobacillus sp. BBL2006 TaxID=1543706 RepID=UPI0005437314|nr:ribonuclease E/G [Halobacillus sp. BBL2006]KHE70604.1 hypothetical protein LD39_11420 [Halobacillus sp. BBL2006]